jgi:hypothetical protein
MDQSAYAERVRVYLRIQSDATADQYPQSLLYISRQVVRFSGSIPQLPSTDVFTSRDKIPHTPPNGDSLRSASLQPTVPVVKVEDEYVADYVFEPDESLEYVYNYVGLEMGKLHTVVSLGRSDLLGGDNGLVAAYIREGFRLGGEVTIGCAAFIGDKATNYLPEPYLPIHSLSEALSSTKASDFFQANKPREGLLVFSVFLQWAGGSGGVQFIEATQSSKSLDLLLQAITNSDTQGDQRLLAKNKAFDVLKRTLCYGSRVTIVGNLSTMAPLNASTAWVLQTTTNVMGNRHRSVTFYTNMLLKHIERLEKQGERTIKALEDKSSRQSEEIIGLKGEIEALNQALTAKESLETEDKTKVLTLQQDLNDARNLQLLRETDLNESKERINELENQIAQRNAGITSRFSSTTGSFEDILGQLRSENEELKRKNAILESTIGALKSCLSPKAKSDAATQYPSQSLSLNAAFSHQIPSRCFKQSTEMQLTEQLASTQHQVESLRNQLSSCPNSMEEDQRQCRALYKLLTECWLYTDWAIKGFKQAFDQMQAAMELKVRDRELKVAAAEYRLSQTHSIHADKLQILEAKAAEAQRLEAEIIELRGKYARKEEECGRMREEFGAAALKLKEKYRAKLKEGKGSAEWEERVRKMREELEEREEQLEMERTRAEKERRELQDQVAALKDLRKPLAANRKA